MILDLEAVSGREVAVDDHEPGSHCWVLVSRGTQAFKREKRSSSIAQSLRRLHGARLLHLGERAAVFDRHHLAEHRAIGLPLGENLGGERRAGEALRAG